MTIPYFAYGSNMDTATLRGRRSITWSRAAPAVARGWRLVVRKPSLLGNAIGAMATIVADPATEVWGVLYEIGAGDLEHLELTEGVRIGHYDRTGIVVEPSVRWHDGASGDVHAVTAVTLTSEVHDPSLLPTTRYMSLLLAGAREHGLPESWLEVLRAIPAAEESAEAVAMRPFFDSAMKKQP